MTVSQDRKLAAPLEIRSMPLSALEAAPYNPRKISAAAMKGLSASMNRFGLVEPLVWNKRTSRLVGGHQRLKVLKAGKATEAPVVVVDLPEIEEKALNVTLNNPAISGEFSDELGPLLAELDTGLPQDIFEELRLDELAEPEQLEEDEVPEVPKVAVTKPGDLWTLGRHRLLCGDATKAEDVELVVGKRKPFLMVTDPPYGVDYSPEWRAQAAANGLLGFSPARGSLGKVLNDDRADWSAAFAIFPGHVLYVWHASWKASQGQIAIQSLGFEIRAQLIWAKPSFAISRGAYNFQHEACSYAVRNGQPARFIGSKSESTLWSLARPTPNGHATQKPIECMARPIRNHDCAAGVYDPFLGSGTTLVAAEQLDRICYGLEIEPRYCDVIVERWQNLTGKKAMRG